MGQLSRTELRSAHASAWACRPARSALRALKNNVLSLFGRALFLSRNPNEGLCGQIPNMLLRAITFLYIEHVPPHMEQRSERGQRPNPISSVSCVSSVVLMRRETGSLHLLAPLLLTGGKGADLVIRGNKVQMQFVSPCTLSPYFSHWFFLEF
jgi:hypothetical protein